MPLAWIAGMVGGAIVLGALLHYGVNDQMHLGAAGAGAILGLVPAFAVLIRFARGHYDSALDEP